MKKFLGICFVTVLLVGIVIGISHASKRERKVEKEEEVPMIEEVYVDELTIPLIEVDSLNPLATRNYQVYQVLGLLYEPLFEYDSDESFRYILADDYSKLDAKTWIITLKRDVTWHGGEMFNAYDVIFTINTLKKNTSVFSANVANVENAERLDGSSIKITLKEEDDFFIHQLTFPIIPEYYFGLDGLENETKNNHPIGTGPYQYQEKKENGDILLSFNTKWWKQSSAKLQTIILRPYATYGEAIKAFKSAQVDMIVTNMAEWKNKFGTIGLNHYSFENAEFEVIIPNCQNMILKNYAVRKAILEGINRENVINSVYDDNAVISDMGVHTNSFSSITSYEYDKEQVGQILLNAEWFQDDAGWHKVIEGKQYDLSFQMLVNQDDLQKVAVAEKVKLDLLECGIDIQIKKVSLNELKERLNNGNFELVLTSLDMKGEDDLIRSVSKNHPRNYAKFESNQMEEVIAKLKMNLENNQEMKDEFYNRYKSEVPYIGLYYKTSTLLTNKSVKGNFNPNWSKVYRNIETFCK